MIHENLRQSISEISTILKSLYDGLSIFTRSAGDKDCSDFATHDEAQTYFESRGGSSTNNVDRLDADHDGIACKNLP